MGSVFHGKSAESETGRIHDGDNSSCADPSGNGMEGAVLLPVPVPHGGGVRAASGIAVDLAVSEPGLLPERMQSLRAELPRRRIPRSGRMAFRGVHPMQPLYGELPKE